MPLPKIDARWPYAGLAVANPPPKLGLVRARGPLRAGLPPVAVVQRAKVHGEDDGLPISLALPPPSPQGHGQLYTLVKPS